MEVARTFVRRHERIGRMDRIGDQRLQGREMLPQVARDLVEEVAAGEMPGGETVDEQTGGPEDEVRTAKDGLEPSRLRRSGRKGVGEAGHRLSEPRDEVEPAVE